MDGFWASLAGTWQDAWPYVVAATFAGILTLFDLDRIFYIPSSVGRKLELRCWWWGFILANALLAALLYGLVKEQAPLKDIAEGFRSSLVGLGYLALVRIKFTTFPGQGQDVVLGLEPAYEGVKRYFFKRINKIALDASVAETKEMAGRHTLDQLRKDAERYIMHNRLLTKEEQDRAKEWVKRTAEGAGVPEDQKKETLAYFILSGQMT